MAAAAQLAINYATQAFPNATSTLLREIISKYTGPLAVAGQVLVATCITPLWEYIYDCLLVNNPNNIDITASYKRIPENTKPEDCARLKENPPNGYSSVDKQIIEKILKNTNDQRPKEQLKIYDKKGTLDDAKAEFKEFGDGSDGEEKDPNVWVKELSNGKRAIVRKISTDEKSNATLSIETIVETTDGKSVRLPLIKVRYYK